MRILRASSSCIGITLMELLVVVAVILFLSMLLLPHGPRVKPRVPSIMCMNNQRQCALGYLMFSTDNNNQFPWNLSATNAAYIPGCTNGYAAADFNELQNVYLKAPFVFVCPTDPVRVALTDLSPLKNLNLSYGAGYDAGTNASASILTIDRHLLADGKPVRPGLFTYTTNQAVGWSSELHRSSAPIGVMSFYDGHAEVVSGKNINAAFMREGLAQVRFAVP